MKDLKEKVFKVLKVLVLSLAVGVSVGYFTFYMMMPSVVVPYTTNPSLLVPTLVLFVLGLVVGFLAEELESTIISVLLGTVLGAVIGWVLFVSPSFHPDLIMPDPSAFIYNVLHAALPLLIIGLVVLFIGGFIGSMLVENLQIKVAPSPFADDDSSGIR